MRTSRISAFFAALLFGAWAATAGAGSAVNLAGGYAIAGHDPVAYFTVNKAVKGAEAHKATHEGATYLFASKENKETFAANPAKYVPQYGGYCAFGVTKQAKFEVDPEAFTIVDGKLYLNKNKDVLETWRKDTKGYISTAETIWPRIADK
jgi:YHS domain-containing protein